MNKINFTLILRIRLVQFVTPSYVFLYSHHLFFDKMHGFLLFFNRFAMTKALAVELGLPENYFADKCSPPMTVFAFWHYPPYPADTDSWGVGPHTDYGMWTFLLQDDIGGLEVEITEGQWVEVKPKPGIVSKLIMPKNPTR